jgi:hypothetical protein
MAVLQNYIYMFKPFIGHPYCFQWLAKGPDIEKTVFQIALNRTRFTATAGITGGDSPAMPI